MPLSTVMSAWRDDGTCVYPGEITASGVFKGKAALEGWFRCFFEQFPSIQSEVEAIWVKCIFDLTGTNVAAVHWNSQLKNREGGAGNNSGVTVIEIKGGKALYARDYISDLGENLWAKWGASAGGSSK